MSGFSYWIYYGIALLTAFHPHLGQKLGYIWNWITTDGAEFVATMGGSAGVWDLLLHGGMTGLFLFVGIKRHIETMKQE